MSVLRRVGSEEPRPLCASLLTADHTPCPGQAQRRERCLGRTPWVEHERCNHQRPPGHLVPAAALWGFSLSARQPGGAGQTALREHHDQEHDHDDEQNGPASSGWPPGVIGDWLPSPAARTLERVLRVLGHRGSLSVLGVVAHQGPVTLARVCELAQFDPSVVRPRLRELSSIGLLAYRPRSGRSVATWEVNNDAMARLGAYFIRPEPAATPPTEDE